MNGDEIPRQTIVNDHMETHVYKDCLDFLDHFQNFSNDRDDLNDYIENRLYSQIFLIQYKLF